MKDNKDQKYDLVGIHSQAQITARKRLDKLKEKNRANRVAKGDPEIGKPRNTDLNLEWIENEYPQYSEWRKFATSWLHSEIHGIPDKLRSLKMFFTQYLTLENVPINLNKFFSRNLKLPDFFELLCNDSRAGAVMNNRVHDFLEFILKSKYAEYDQHNRLMVNKKYYNPIPKIDTKKYWKPYESVYSTLPYGYIEQLIDILAQGQNFCDWVFAQKALGAREGNVGGPGSDWFPVTENIIDKDDPDCVYRIRNRVKELGGPILELWSPVRWVALLLKLLLPLRTAQVRLLDSGEADTWRYTNNGWVLNKSNLKEGTIKNPLQQGVFRKQSSLEDFSTKTVLYINTNKTADINKNGKEKGYILNWEHKQVLYWLEKLRNWQEKYNPIDKRTDWSELDTRYIKTMSVEQLSTYPAACFLFRLAEARYAESRFPLHETGLRKPWYKLLKELETRLEKKGITHQNGEPIKFVYSDGKTDFRVYFPLHSLRVSLITAYALDGEVPFPILQKIVGHSRLLMTIYYTKPSEAQIQSSLSAGMKLLEEKKESSIINFLASTSHNEILKKAICNSTNSLSTIIPRDRSDRNPAGWMLMHHGACLVGGNISPHEGNNSLGGCYNGGPNTGSETVPVHGLVPGGVHNCIRCRWFVTFQHYLPALVAHFNNIAYKFNEVQNTCMLLEREKQDLKLQKAEAENSDNIFNNYPELLLKQRLFEDKMNEFNVLIENLTACNNLIEVCIKILNDPEPEEKKALIALGDIKLVKRVFEQTESELLQLSGICTDIELYPDLQLKEPILRRSQILDIFLYSQDHKPIFMTLTPDDQLKFGNAYIRHLAQQINPNDIVLGMRSAIIKIEECKKLSNTIDTDYSSLIRKQLGEV